jgi:hypothetical protein
MKIHHKKQTLHKMAIVDLKKSKTKHEIYKTHTRVRAHTHTQSIEGTNWTTS